jgi:hypothetical protein
VPPIGFVRNFHPRPVRHATKSQQTNRRIPGWFRASGRKLATLWAGKGARRRGAQPAPRVRRECPTSAGRKGGARVTNLFPRLSSRKVLHQTDGYLWLVFSAPRSIPAFPTPLRRVIGHHWPWYRLPGPMAFLGTLFADPMARSGRIAGADAALCAVQINAKPRCHSSVRQSPPAPRSRRWTTAIWTRKCEERGGRTRTAWTDSQGTVSPGLSGSWRPHVGTQGTV